MRTNGIQATPSFGAFRLKGYGGQALANKFYGYSDPKIAEDDFTKKYVKPLQTIKTEVEYDGYNVFLHDPKYAKVINVLDEAPKVEENGKYLTRVDYPIKPFPKDKDNQTVYSIFYEPDDVPNLKAKSGIETQLLAAYEIAKDMEKNALISETKEDAAIRLNNLYA